MSKQRCYKCNKKIKIVVFSCRCNHIFCSKCRYPENHSCNFNYINNEKNILKKYLPKVVAKKIEFI